MIRRLFTISFLIWIISLAGLNGFAQSLSLSDSAGFIAPNSVIFQSGDPGHGAFNTYVWVTNASGSTIEVKCKKTEISMLDSTLVFICWAGICYSPNIYVSTHTQLIGPGQVYNGFKGTYYQANHSLYPAGESKIRWTWFSADEPDDSVSVTVIYSTLPVGMAGRGSDIQNRSTVAPNPAGRYINLYPASWLKAPFEVYLSNTAGRVLRRYQIPHAGDRVNLDVSGMARGHYLLQIIQNEKNREVIKISIDPR